MRSLFSFEFSHCTEQLRAESVRLARLLGKGVVVPTAQNLGFERNGVNHCTARNRSWRHGSRARH